ncbi:Xylose isomerase-like, TIM barrel domain protein [Niveomyces insectorum RCEF 264]|uniref:Xylose isomerase-like, TIM barrel domain protein n=1 Tax=Niveomyces insectorum RCEF 264 TaxID=1081102 RepID=A0A167TH39_9HYPO|nr:Xylose isomerase-like, TIM barrel domain protein [Niveomyces insectorum RCEF 264]
MASLPPDLAAIPMCFASCSIGLAHHTLHQKIEAIAAAGFGAIELAFPDLKAFASRHFGREIADDDYANLVAAVRAVRDLCAAHQVRVLVVQPFVRFEGWPPGSAERADAFARARGWIAIMDAAGTDILQVGASDAPAIADVPESQLVDDLRELADLLAAKGFRLAYENWCWATRAATWRAAWDLVRQVDRPNVGLCLDTFQSAGGEWGDPTSPSGRVADSNDRWRNSLRALAATVAADKIFYLQISDAYKADPPLDCSPHAKSELRPRCRWSNSYRPLPYDGGNLPIRDFVEAVLATRFRGWFSMEVFDGRFAEKYGNDLARFAKTAMEAHKRLLGEADPGKISGRFE